MTKHRLKSTLCVLKVAIINSTPPPQYLIWIHSVYLGCGQVFRALIIDAYPLTNRAIFFFLEETRATQLCQLNSFLFQCLYVVVSGSVSEMGPPA